MYIEYHLFPVVQFIFDNEYMLILLSIGQGVKMQMDCKGCRGTLDLIAFNTFKCKKCGKEYDGDYAFGKPCRMKEIRDKWKRFMHSKWNQIRISRITHRKVFQYSSIKV